MRIVHIEDFFHPEAGYQVNLLSKYQIKMGDEVFIITAELKQMPHSLSSFFGIENIKNKDDAFTLNTGVKIIRLPLIAYFSGRAIYQNRIFKLVKDLNPDILYVHGNDTYIGIRYILKSKKIGFPIISDSHMLEMASKNPLRKVFQWWYKNTITPKIIKNQISIIRTVDDNYIEKCLGIPLTRSILIPFGTDTDFFKPDSKIKTNFRKTHNIQENEFIVIYAGKLDEAKGGLFLAKSIIDEFVLENGKKIVFIIVGNTIGEYGNKVETTFSESKNRIIRFPTKTYTELPTLYKSGDFAIFPKQCSLSFFDVQACELPVVFEDNIINNERVNFENGFTFKGNNIEDFRKKIIHCANLDKNEFNKLAQNSRRFIIKNYDYNIVANKYAQVINNEFEKFHSRKK